MIKYSTGRWVELARNKIQQEAYIASKSITAEEGDWSQ